MKTDDSMHTQLLRKIAAKIKTGSELMGSRWQNCEAEVIALQTISACALNLKQHGDAFSWLAESCTRGRNQAGTNNSRGLQLLTDDQCLLVEPYAGPAKAPKGTATRDGKPLVLRCTPRLLHYAASEML
jgi:hypothetical protein